MRNNLNIYMCGVGGQGIGLLSEVMTRVFYKLGNKLKAVDTHGLAQRGGSVVSQLRVGENIYSPLISPGKADIIISLERLETLRAMSNMLSNKGKVIFYDAQFQTIDNRLGNFNYPEYSELEISASEKDAEIIKVFRDDLPDSRMQNIALLDKLVKTKWIDGLTFNLLVGIMKEILPQKLYKSNIQILSKGI